MKNIHGMDGRTTHQYEALEGKRGEVGDGVNPIAGKAEVAESRQGVQPRDRCDLVTCR